MPHALIFDSGIGGLSVAQHIRGFLPGVSMSYVADDAFRPYGNKTEAQLNARLPGLLRTLEIMTAPDVIVIACNTASTTALPGIRAAVTAPVVGVVPAIKPAAAGSKTKTIAVLGTPGTVRREYVQDLIDDFAADCRVILHGSTDLVELAELKLSGLAVQPARIKAALDPVFNARGGGDIDAIVLACTHFPLLVPELAAAAGRPIDWIDSGAAIARRVGAILKDVNTPKQANVALLIGPESSVASEARKAAFARFGFDRVVGLIPEP